MCYDSQKNLLQDLRAVPVTHGNGYKGEHTFCKWLLWLLGTFHTSVSTSFKDARCKISMEFIYRCRFSNLCHSIAPWRTLGGRGDEDEDSLWINSYAPASPSPLFCSRIKQWIDKAVVFILQGQALGSVWKQEARWNRNRAHQGKGTKKITGGHLKAEFSLGRFNNCCGLWWLDSIAPFC